MSCASRAPTVTPAANPAPLKTWLLTRKESVKAWLEKSGHDARVVDCMIFHLSVKYSR